jgi:hypothetical protein
MSIGPYVGMLLFSLNPLSVFSPDAPFSRNSSIFLGPLHVCSVCSDLLCLVPLCTEDMRTLVVLFVMALAAFGVAKYVHRSRSSSRVSTPLICMSLFVVCCVSALLV